MNDMCHYMPWSTQPVARPCSQGLKVGGSIPGEVRFLSFPQMGTRFDVVYAPTHRPRVVPTCGW